MVSWLRDAQPEDRRGKCVCVCVCVWGGGGMMAVWGARREKTFGDGGIFCRFLPC